MELVINRTYHADGTNGELLLDGKMICFTIELPWKNNHRRISCIPEGRYKLRKRLTQRFGMHLLVESVSGRDGILIHSFNNAIAECLGCIGPVTTLTGNGKGINSRVALKRLIELVSPALDVHKTVFLTIKQQSNENVDQKNVGAHAPVL